MHPLTLSITQDFQAESVTESDFPEHHSSIKSQGYSHFFLQSYLQSACVLQQQSCKGFYML